LDNIVRTSLTCIACVRPLTFIVSSRFQLTIRVSDVNDNAPKFELPDYQAHNVDEDIPLGTNILKVKATDADSGANAEIEYLVSDDHFSVDSNGIIVNNKQLDADNNNAYYEFIVTAKDKGKLPQRIEESCRVLSTHRTKWSVDRIRVGKLQSLSFPSLINSHRSYHATIVNVSRDLL